MVSIEYARVLEEFPPLQRWAMMMCNHGERQPKTSGEEMIKRSTRPRSGRLEPVWLWVEPAAALVIAVILFFPLKKKDLAELTGIFGILLTVSAIATTVRLRGEFDSVRKLSQAVDLSRTCNVQLINELFRLYLIVKEPELTPIKDDAVHACMAVLGKLAHDKVSPEMTSGEYYSWLLNVLATVPKDTRVNAVSVMAESSWTEIPAESRFLEANVAAAKRGVHIERIFITTRERMTDPNNRVVLSRHIEHENQGLSAYVVWEEELSKQDPSLLMDAGVGFISFDDRVALLDTAVPPGTAKGIVTMSGFQLRQMDRVFNKLKLHSVKAADDLFQRPAAATSTDPGAEVGAVVDTEK